MAYKHVIRAKTKNLFDISKIVESTNLKNNKDGTITVSVYGVSGGLLKNLCPELKVGDVIKVYFQPLRWTATKPPLVIVVGDVVVDRTLNSTLTVTEKSLNKPVMFYNNHYDERGLPGTTIIGNILITTDLTITNKNHNERYTPYNYLQSNKRMIKVNDVCQLYAKNIWQEYTDLYGVSIKNNNDGSITLNGTATETFFYTNILDYEIKPNHVYFYFDAYNEEPSWSTYVGGCEGKIIDAGGESGANYAIYNLKREGTIAKARSDLPKNLLNTFCGVYKGFTLNNVTIKPQLFDLTEMFGAGHEPATVAEFRQRFPNELYPYSPQCWLTSYKSAVVCKTKNLFDVNNAAPYTFANDNYDSNLVWLKDDIYTTRMNNYNLGSGLRIKNGLSLPAGTYTVSAKIVDFNNVEKFVIGFRYKTTDGTWKVSSYPYEKYKVGGTIALRVTLPENTDVRLYLTYQNNNGVYLTGYVSYKDIQLEQGSTATSYVPYQHL